MENKGVFPNPHPPQPVDAIVLGPMVSPPQMPVSLKRMYNANILRAEITAFVPSCPLM